ncbi:hypothetical protein [Roseofilum capinflatum]|uniref:Uncharacterized protein n=1 Tax=Roseofilum capinflatum BLCC-M114 TaxID=3022440 RepID=A0ABT7BAI3_9CYAN|nr:hypothetical protein [Roseofilum capinflatum]MDJ1176105.1 hypothetical protein [Roseofilum capinflatum BLCC-M114]
MGTHSSAPSRTGKTRFNYCTSLHLEVQDGKIILTPINEEANLSYEGSVLVVNSEKTDNLDIIHALREERIQEQMNWRVF